MVVGRRIDLRRPTGWSSGVGYGRENPIEPDPPYFSVESDLWLSTEHRCAAGPTLHQPNDLGNPVSTGAALAGARSMPSLGRPHDALPRVNNCDDIDARSLHEIHDAVRSLEALADILIARLGHSPARVRKRATLVGVRQDSIDETLRV